MVLKTYHITDALVKSPGYPETWEQKNVDANPPLLIGLVHYNHIISEEKLAKFVNMNETAAKNIMKINLYNYYFVLKTTAGENVFISGSVPEGKFTVNLARPVLYQNKLHILEFAVWKD